jgi:predicted DNA-binding protein
LSLFFDKRDRDLLKIVNGVLRRPTPAIIGKKGLFPWFHPHGIKELAETRGLRIAYAIIHLLESLEAGDLEDRLNALRSLRDEVLHASAGTLPKNAARVLLSIMKDLIRAHGNEMEQLKLAHDFRRVASGKPSIVRAMLRRYHLLEMPEAWNQLAFDDHVHDINTKGANPLPT